MPGAVDLNLLQARHVAANTLVSYLRAVDAQDLPGVLKVVGRATISFGGPAVGGEALYRTYSSAFAAAGRTRHLLHEVEVGWTQDGQRIAARASYQRWSLESNPPVLTAIGHYLAIFEDVETQELDLIELTVHRDWQLDLAIATPRAGAAPMST